MEMYDICCHECNANYSDIKGFAMSEEEKNEMVDTAITEGWTHEDGLNLCPACSKSK